MTIKTAQMGAEGKRGVRLTAKSYLNSIRYLDSEITAKQTELEHLKKDAESLRGITYNSDKVQGGGTNDPMQIVDKIVGLQNVINEEIDKLVDLKEEARRRIARVCHPKFISLLTDLYINCFTLEQVAERENVTYTTICRWHGDALEIFRNENGML